MLFELKNLIKTYQDRTVLDIEQLSLTPEKIYGLLGPNGSGKTTLLEILGFLRPPDSGRIFYQSRPVDFSGRLLRRLRREIVLVQQSPVLFTTTVSKNVEFGLKVRQVPKKSRAKTVDEMLDLVGLRGLASAAAHHLSGGETQRVAIARALACSPRVILLDEPTANVDAEHQAVVENIIREIKSAKGLSIIFTTHNMVQAARLAEEIVFLFDGRPTAGLYENIFSGVIGFDGDRRGYCLIQERFRLPVAAGKPGPARVLVNPRLIKIKPQGTAEAAGSNLSGLVRQLTWEGEQVRVLVDVGLPLTVLVGFEEYQSHPLSVGRAVVVDCPAEAVEVI